MPTKNKLFCNFIIISCILHLNLLAQSSDTLITIDESKRILLIESIPTSSTVILDSIFSGMTPIAIPINNIKRHQISIHRSGFIPYKCEIATDFKDTLRIIAILQKHSGSISVFSENDQSIIKINGREYGNGRIDSLNLEIGTYELSVIDPSYQREISTEAKIDQLKHYSFKSEYDIISTPRLLGSIALPGYAQLSDDKYIKGIGFTLAAVGSVAFMISKYARYSSAEDAYKTALHNYDFAFDESTAILARNEAERKQVEYQTSKKNFEISLAVVAIVWVVNAIDVGLNHLLSDRINAFTYATPGDTKQSTTSNYWLSLTYRLE